TSLLASMDVHKLVAASDRLYMFVREGADFALWTSDGTAGGTHHVAKIGTAAEFSDYGFYTPPLVTVGSKAYFIGDDGAHGKESWSSDGTPENTGMVADVNPGAGGFDDTGYGFSHVESALTAVGNSVYFDATDGTTRTVWTSDGTALGTHAIEGLN